MEDDDEFGDLYTDVLQPFASSSSAPQPHHSSPAPSSIDLNLNLNLHDPQIPYAASHSNSAAPDDTINQITPPDRPESIPAAAAAIDGVDDASGEPRVDKVEESADGARILDVEFTDIALPERTAVAGADGNDPMDKDVKFDIEDDDGEIGSEPVIPGLSSDAGVSRRVGEGGEGGDGGEGDDWDSDSEDDLQIVLNDNNHMAMERGGMVDDDDDEDEDGGLVIVAGGDPNQGVEEQEWGENTTLPVDGERKDAAELAKATIGGGSVATAVPKSGYSNHGYHSFHSPFKVSVLCCLSWKGIACIWGFFL